MDFCGCFPLLQQSIANIFGEESQTSFTTSRTALFFDEDFSPKEDLSGEHEKKTKTKSKLKKSAISEQDEYKPFYYQNSPQIRPKSIPQRHKNSAASASPPKVTKLCRVLFVGDTETGKSNLRSRLASESIAREYKPTLGVDFSKIQVMKQHTLYDIVFLDFSGQERFNIYCTRGKYKDIRACCVVFDITRRDSFDNVNYWKSKFVDGFDDNDVDAIPVYLIANKMDEPLSSHQVSMEEAKEFARMSNMKLVATSGRTGKGCDELKQELVNVICHNRR